MDKPISVIINETREELTNAVNGAIRKVHPSILEPIVKELYLSVVKYKDMVEKSEIEKYNNELEKENSENEYTSEDEEVLVDYGTDADI